MSNLLYPGESLLPGDRLLSENGQNEFLMQDDGNLVLYQNINGKWEAAWSTRTNGNKGASALFQKEDGNFVVYNEGGGQALWNSGTNGKPADRLIVQDDGNVVIYDKNNAPLWDVKTVIKSEYKICTELGNDIPSLSLASLKGKLWDVGQTVRVRFLNGEKAIQEKVENSAHEWETHANIKFEFGDFEDAEIRVSFNKGEGSWSKIGKDCLSVVNKNESTMNFGWFDTKTSDEEITRVTLHEFGHALGFVHEHQSPSANIPWDRDKVLEYYTKILPEDQRMTEDEVNEYIFEKYNQSRTIYSPFDPKSIMLYPVPEELTVGDFRIDWNTTLSEMDKIWANIYYPKTKNAIALQGHNGKYVCADNVDTPELDEPCLTLTRDNIGDWETFEMIYLGNNKVALRSHRNNKYLSAERGGWRHSIVTASRDNIGDWETFEATIMENDKITLLSHKNCYLTHEGSENRVVIIKIYDPVMASHHKTISGPITDRSIFTIKKP